MEEQLLNPHYNQSKFSPDRYMMLNRDRDRERGLPRLFETKALIGMVLIPMFLLVSFGFESLPLPDAEVILDFFFRMPGKVPHLYTFFIIIISSGLYKTE